MTHYPTISLSLHHQHKTALYPFCWQGVAHIAGQDCAPHYVFTLRTYRTSGAACTTRKNVERRNDIAQNLLREHRRTCRQADHFSQLWRFGAMTASLLRFTYSNAYTVGTYRAEEWPVAGPNNLAHTVLR